MDTETPNPPSSLLPLLPERHPQHDLFICDVADAVLKDVMPQMEHPFYSLSKKPETAVRRYEHNGHWIEVTPSVKGLATIYDKDILIYCISQVMAKLKRGEKVSQRVRINRATLIFTNRGTAGKDYMALIEALDRLEGTRIRTNIVTGDEEQIDGFGLIDASSIRRKHGLDGRLLWCEIKLSDWVFNAIRAQRGADAAPGLFPAAQAARAAGLRARAQALRPAGDWKVSLETLLRKSGSQSPEKRFRQMIKHLADERSPAGLPRRVRRLETDMVTFLNRGTMKAGGARRASRGPAGSTPRPTRTPAGSRRAGTCITSNASGGEWLGENEIAPKHPERHFVKFCQTWFEKRGRP